MSHCIAAASRDPHPNAQRKPLPQTAHLQISALATLWLCRGDKGIMGSFRRALEALSFRALRKEIHPRVSINKSHPLNQAWMRRPPRPQPTFTPFGIPQLPTH